MKKFLGSKLVLSLVALVILASAFLIPSLWHHAPAAHAANGDFVAEVTFSQNCGSSIGVGITYDGANLWYSCYNSSPDLYRADPHTGTVTASYTIAGGLGSLAYDANSNEIWAGWGNSTDSSAANVRLIKLDGSKNVTSNFVQFQAPQALVCGLDDGLAYDGTDNTLFLSDDCSQTIYHYDATGTLLGSSAWAGAAAGSNCYNSGLGLGGNLLFQGSDGCSHVYVTDKTTPSGPVKFDFSTIVSSDPNFRDEGLTCDPNTFASQGKQVMWSKEAYSPMRAHAYEIPNGSCGYGGKPVDLFSNCDDFKQNLMPSGFAVTPTCNPGDTTKPYVQTPWNHDLLGLAPNTYTVGGYGCLLSSSADVFRVDGTQTLPNGQVLDPGTLNHYLQSVKGAFTPGTAELDTPIAAAALGYSEQQLFPRSQGWLPELTAALKQGELPIISVHNQGHWIVLYEGVNEVNGAFTDFRILDPWVNSGVNGDNSGKLLSAVYGSGGSIQNLIAPMRVVLYSKNNLPKRTFVWQGHSPIELLVTAPNGAQTGFVPGTQTTIQNIPSTSYGTLPDLTDDNPDGLPPLPGSVSFQMDDPVAGTYALQVIGTGTGPYHLEFAEADAGGSTSDYILAGNTVPGAIDTYLITVSSTPGQPVSIQLQVQVDVKPGEDPPAINPNSKGVTPVAILSTSTFDASTIDPKSVKFGPKRVSAVHSALEDVNGDGRLDLVLQFPTDQTGITSGDTQACLTGATTAGVSIGGCDTITTTSS